MHERMGRECLKRRTAEKVPNALYKRVIIRCFAKSR
jgi:hypothetical protein